MMKKRIMSILLAVVMVLGTMIATSSVTYAAAEHITISDATYYASGALKSIKTQFDWGTGAATVRLVLMTQRLRSAGEEGTSSSYGDFTDLGHYGNEFDSFEEVQDYDSENNGVFGIVSYSAEKDVVYNSTNNELEINFEETDIPLNEDGMYYVYLWTEYYGNWYPDNLFVAINVQDGVVQYTPATGRNSYNEEAFVKVVSQVTYDVTVTQGEHMKKATNSGAESQTDLGVPMTPVVYVADEGYYFPENYAVTSVNGIKVTRDSETQITVSGMPTDNTQITMTAPTRKLLPLEEMVFTYAYDVQRYPAYPAKGDTIKMSGLAKPCLADGSRGTTNEGSWTLTPIGTYGLIKDGEKASANLKYIVESVAEEYDNLDADTIVLHELKDGDTHIAYGITVAYNQDDSMAVFLGDNWGGGAGYLLSVESKSGTVETVATEILTDWVAPPVYDITVADAANGTTETSAAKAIAGETITITATPKQGYQVDSVKYNDGEDHDVSLVGGKYTFEMPAKNVTVKVTYKAVTTVPEGNEGNQATNNQTTNNQTTNEQTKNEQTTNNQLTTESDKETESPQTGDVNQFFIWFAFAAGSCVIYKCVLEHERSKKRIRRH